MLSADVHYAVQKLIELGVLDEAALERIARLFRDLDALTGTVEGQTVTAKRRDGALSNQNGQSGSQPEEADGGDQLVKADPEVPAPTELTSPPAPTLSLTRTSWTSFAPTALEMQNLRDAMTVAQIARLYGVSSGTVQKRLREYGLTKSG